MPPKRKIQVRFLSAGPNIQKSDCPQHSKRATDICESPKNKALMQIRGFICVCRCLSASKSPSPFDIVAVRLHNPAP